MPAIVTDNIRVLSANQFINAFQNKKYDAWESGKSYTVGDVVYNSFYKYIATTSGISGASAPAHTSGVVSDGGVDWLFVEQFQNTTNFNNNIYVTIGKTSPWDNPSVGDETPIAPVNDFTSQLQNLLNVISAKRLDANVVKMAIRRYDWDASGQTVYSQFDPDVTDFNYPTPFYVLAGNNVYKCLNNNGGSPSTTQPTGTSPDPFVTPGDSYLWQYMCTVEPTDAVQFLTNTYIPVSLKLSDDSSPQWAVQQNAKRQSISTIVVDNGGSGYTSATVTIDPPASGGTQAVATPIIQGGVITAIQLSVIGEGYDTAPNVTITGDGTGATAHAVMAPKDGHGANVLTELNARYVIINARFDDSENGYFPVSGESDFRQIGILVDPLDVNGNPAELPRYIGMAHDDWDGSETSGKSELMPGTGYMLYIENIEPIVRAPGQIEDLKIVLKF